MRILRTITIIAATLAPTAVLANALAVPTGEVILTIEGNIANTNGEGVAVFDLAMLDALPQRTTTTETPWYDDAQSFSGPVIQSLLEAIGAQGTTVTVRALNDYSAEIPIEDLQANPVILASRLNGDVLSVRDKGPLFVVYPFDLDPSLYNEVYFGRSVWQVVSVTVN
jgi:hypothetical protein